MLDPILVLRTLPLNIFITSKLRCYHTVVFQLTGFSGTQYSHEYTVIDPQERTMSLTTRNVSRNELALMFLQLFAVPFLTTKISA